MLPGSSSPSDQPSTATDRPTITSSTSSTPTAPAAPGKPTYDSSTCTWEVPGAGRFNHKREFNFLNKGGHLPDGLTASNYLVQDTYAGAPYNHKFEAQNVYSDGELLNLKVPGVPIPPSDDPGYAISSAEIVTTEDKILYASIFFYLDDTQEVDIEYLTHPESQGNNIHQKSSTGAPIPIWFCNQAMTSGASATQRVGPAPVDVSELHEYRIDWTKDFTAFYIDGILQKRHTTNVPNKPGRWIWNNWANGDYGWSAGPPSKDNIFKIQNITMYYNTIDDSKRCQ
ncbi:hypothetical protein LTR70_008749 [Exophiala xenobiotica]|uniref:GH16 domain-containing protein n=1 Tax=Lithohypha guttulata TaxID=1690604 RepID=A0ABR0JZK9_9EURO|nr:hypothetical protein LTR24_008567 [Lithohypha guttulata]KAK5311522.1 hypothetical protein LTR70_008749 [Exophiala xenobiotica]